jgi:hypothetical protein
MARASQHLIEALIETAARLEGGAVYSWGHLGSCNCGHLTQTLTGLTPDEIHRDALQRGGDWGDVSDGYCPTSGLAVDTLISGLLQQGLHLEDIEHLEELDDPKVLRRLPAGLPRYLERNNREHASAYFRAWANVMRESLDREN